MSEHFEHHNSVSGSSLVASSPKKKMLESSLAQRITSVTTVSHKVKFGNKSTTIRSLFAIPAHIHPQPAVVGSSTRGTTAAQLSCGSSMLARRNLTIRQMCVTSPWEPCLAPRDSLLYPKDLSRPELGHDQKIRHQLPTPPNPGFHESNEYCENIPT